MIAFLSLVLLAVGAFVVGSIPVGVLIGRRFFRTDIRAHGSGNVGAANALRQLGLAGGATVLVLDVLKGLLPALLEMSISGPTAAGTAALFAVLGHCYSPWLNFRGGKGVATWLGGAIAISWLAGLAFALVWLALVLPSRLASLGSILASFVAAVVIAAVYWGHPAVAIAAFFTVAVIVARHRENIDRLRTRTEHKLEFGRKPASD